MDHPNIVKIYETYETSKEIYLILEIWFVSYDHSSFCAIFHSYAVRFSILSTGGELYEALTSRHTYTEKDASTLFYQVSLLLLMIKT